MAMLRELGFSCETVDHLLDRAQRYLQIQRFRAQTEEELQSDPQAPDE